MASINKSADKKQRSGGIGNYFKSVWSELKKVQWPDKKMVIKYTATVIGTVAVATVLIFVVDTVLSMGFQGLFGLFE